MSKSRTFLRSIKPTQKDKSNMHSAQQQVARYSGKVRDKVKQKKKVLIQSFSLASLTRFDFASVLRKADRRKFLVKPGVGQASLFLHNFARRRPKQFKIDLSSVSLPKLKLPQGTLKFAALAVAVVLLVQAGGYLSNARSASKKILGEATSAYSDLTSAAQGLTKNPQTAITLFDSAQNDLQNAQSRLNSFQLLKLVSGQAQSADTMLKGASFLASAGKQLGDALALFDKYKFASQGASTPDLGSLMDQSNDLFRNSLSDVQQAEATFANVGSLPQGYDETLKQTKNELQALTTALQNIISFQDLYLSLFQEGSKTYLLAFENYDEMRATGGFIGTYGALKTANGKISSLEIASVYNLDGSLTDRVAAPGPFQPDIKGWGLRDANWFADFSQSAQKLLFFFEQEKESADGVIAITPQTFEQILDLTGPIYVDGYDQVLTSKNFQEVVQFKTSVDYDKQLNEPKKFLADFVQALLSRLGRFDSKQFLSLLQIVNNNFDQKQILIYTKDQTIQNKIENLGWAGKILPTNHDYLSVLNSNLGGTKTDLSIKQYLNFRSKIFSDGSIVDTLTITRHNSSDLFNKNYIRILVPEGSQLVSARGLDFYPYHSSQAPGYKTDPDLAIWDGGKMQAQAFITKEANKTEFAGFITAQPKSSTSVTFVYSLPFRINVGLLKPTADYSLLIQKQPGNKLLQFDGIIDLGKLSSTWVGSNASVSGNQIKFSSDLSTDQFFGMVLK